MRGRMGVRGEEDKQERIDTNYNLAMYSRMAQHASKRCREKGVRGGGYLHLL